MECKSWNKYFFQLIFLPNPYFIRILILVFVLVFCVGFQMGFFVMSPTPFISFPLKKMLRSLDLCCCTGSILKCLIYFLHVRLILFLQSSDFRTFKRAK